MVDLEKVKQCLVDHGVEFISGVPDTLLNDFCLMVNAQWPKSNHVIAANEGNSVGLAVGYHLSTGTIPLVYMQNSGIGNTVNPLISLAHESVYSIPMVILAGWRGEPNRKDHPQHTKQGELTPVLFDNMDIPYRILEDDTVQVVDSFRWALETAKSESSPVALIALKNVLEKGEKDDFPASPTQPSREEAISFLLDVFPDSTIFVASTGRATRELYEVRRLKTLGHQNDFLNVGAMGHTSSIAQGIAAGNSERLVVCLDGDASTIMHLGALTTSGIMDLSNFVHIVLNNGAHESVGGQPSAGKVIDLNGIARSCGYQTASKAVEDLREIPDIVKALVPSTGPVFIEVKIRKGMRKDLPPLVIEPLKLKELLMTELGKKARGSYTSYKK